jgi:hypothetical protein
MQDTTKFMERLNIFHCGTTRLSCVLQHPETVWMFLGEEGTVFGFFFCNIPFHALTFCFRIKLMKPTFVAFQDSVKKFVTFDGITFQQM